MPEQTWTLSRMSLNGKQQWALSITVSPQSEACTFFSPLDHNSWPNAPEAVWRTTSPALHAGAFITAPWNLAWD
jgi:hypothetical protein